MRRLFKVTVVFLFLALFVGLLAGFAIPANPLPIVTAAGSSSLNPLFTRLSDVWPHDASLNVAGGGSGFGIRTAALNTSDIGLASRDPYRSVQRATVNRNGYEKANWETNQIKTFTFAFDSIAIVYKTKDAKDHPLQINEHNFALLYELFSGKSQVAINTLIPNSSDSNVFIPYGRTGGANASGTATSFLLESHFDWEANKQKDPSFEIVQNALQSGNYLNNNVRVTNESNVETWNRLKYENMNGAITYLSLSFALQNLWDIERNGFQIAHVRGVDPNQFAGENERLDLNFLQTYKWFGPFNIMISLKQDLLSPDIKEFVRFLYMDPLALSNISEQKLFGVGNFGTAGFLQAMVQDEFVNLFNETNFEKNFTHLFNPMNSDIALEKAGKKNYDNHYGIPAEFVLQLKGKNDS